MLEKLVLVVFKYRQTHGGDIVAPPGSFEYLPISVVYDVLLSIQSSYQAKDPIMEAVLAGMKLVNPDLNWPILSSFRHVKDVTLALACADYKRFRVCANECCIELARAPGPRKTAILPSLRSNVNLSTGICIT
jgi:hypothetical protein